MPYTIGLYAWDKLTTVREYSQKNERSPVPEAKNRTHRDEGHPDRNVIPFTGCHLNSCNLLNSISIHSLSAQLRTKPNLKGPKNNKIEICFVAPTGKINQCLWISVLMFLQNILTLKTGHIGFSSVILTFTDL